MPRKYGESTTMKNTKFKPGNPGRPNGSRNKVTQAVEALLDGDAEALTRKAIEKAKDGDMVALRLCLDRLCPPRKDRHIELDLPKADTSSGVTKAHSAVLDAMAQGEITPDEANTIAGILEAKRRSIETHELEARISKLEHEKD